MNISYNWLKDLIDIDLSPSDLGQRLTNVGLAVEGIHAHRDDFVFDIDLTSNRPDCLSHHGVAREIAVITRKKLAEIPASSEAPLPAVLASDSVRIDEPDLCHRFTARIIRNVKIGPSPQWLVDRLEAIGERSINNVADITNYVMHELGQPMHSFDLDKLEGRRIVVRRALEGETITTLDEVERNLTTDMLAICDAEKPVAVGGVMGSLDSSITENTVNVLLEVAYFKRENIRATSRKLRLSTEASYRFERGVDIDNLIRASNRATELICELAGGTAGDLIDVYPTQTAANRVESNDIAAAVKHLTGLDLSTEECNRILENLGIARADESAIYTAPSWRHDIHIEEDLVEEVARHTGYENIGTELPPAFGAGEYQPGEEREKSLRQKLVDIGFNEALSYSFIDTRFDKLFEPVPGLVDDNAAEKLVTLQDSVIEGALLMRPSALPGLLDAIRLNFNHKRRDLRIFEMGKVFAGGSGEDGLPSERKVIAMVLTGSELSGKRALAVRELDFYDATGAVEAALEAAGVADIEIIAADIRHLRTGQAAIVIVNGIPVGTVGRLSDNIVTSHRFKQPVYVAEIDLEAVLEVAPEQVVFQPLARYPGIERDVSFVVPRDVTFAQIRAAAAAHQFELCRNIEFVDIYEGKGLAENERSITIRLEYRSDERTLVEDEVEAVHARILNHIDEQLRIHPRL
jgi:phenylalanyl-tRNA synthetase beta chain